MNQYAAMREPIGTPAVHSDAQGRSLPLDHEHRSAISRRRRRRDLHADGGLDLVRGAADGRWAA